MNKLFTYSVLRYRHSLVLGETLNVGLLFHFPEEPKLFFVVGDADRVKAVYPGFDAVYFNSVIRSFRRTLDAITMEDAAKTYSIKEYILNRLLPEDATALHFTEPFTSVDIFVSPQVAIESVVKIFLPEHQLLKGVEIRHNDAYLVRRCTELITQGNRQIGRKLRHNRVIEDNTLTLTFDIAWKNGIEHLVKPVSFDLKGEQDIQDKSVRFFGYLNLLKGYAEKYECTFDLLVSKPQDSALQGSYEDAVARLKSANAPLEVIPEEGIEPYAAKTAAVLQQKEE
jgi:hypothetical protein